jgi:osmoprotectant transport system ATP-binding protein
MDEPFGAIDPITRSKLQDEFLKIQAKIKKTIAFVTHDINEAIKMGDTIALLQKGELIQYADPATLLYSPANEFVRNFVGSDRILKGLRLHKAKEVMKEPPFHVVTEDSPSKVKEQMEKAMQRWSIAVDKQNRFIGWVTYEDIEENKSIADIVKPPTATASPDTPLNEALSMMLNSAIGTLSVLDDDERLLGVLSFQIIRDVLGKQIENAGTEEERG